MSERRTPAIDQVEHDRTFKVRKVSNFIDNGAGSVVRQAGDSSGRTLVKLSNTLVTEPYDYVGHTSTATTDTYVFKSGGSGGTTVATVVLTYTTSTKDNLDNVVKT